jgi:hypothetical protein
MAQGPLVSDYTARCGHLAPLALAALPNLLVATAILTRLEKNSLNTSVMSSEFASEKLEDDISD